MDAGYAQIRDFGHDCKSCDKPKVVREFIYEHDCCNVQNIGALHLGLLIFWEVLKHHKD